jgi:hypothetical protein
MTGNCLGSSLSGLAIAEKTSTLQALYMTRGLAWEMHVEMIAVAMDVDGVIFIMAR